MRLFEEEADNDEDEDSNVDRESDEGDMDEGGN
jgi:hypothetical protein